MACAINLGGKNRLLRVSTISIGIVTCGRVLVVLNSILVLDLIPRLLGGIRLLPNVRVRTGLRSSWWC